MLVKSLHNQILCICITIFVYMYDVIYNDIIKAPTVIPSHLLNHRVVETANLIPKKLANALLEDIKHDRSFPTNAQDTRFYKILHEKVGQIRFFFYQNFLYFAVETQILGIST